MVKGTCQKQNPFRGIITVSDKGQISIPSYLRDELRIQRGDKLIVLKRKDTKGFTCIKEDVIKKTFQKLADN
jgi:AbrB family looped-hinge helix DNA binding protein